MLLFFDSFEFELIYYRISGDETVERVGNWFTALCHLFLWKKGLSNGYLQGKWARSGQTKEAEKQYRKRQIKGSKERAREK